jgi:putative hydrolase of the HAD superfamily
VQKKRVVLWDFEGTLAYRPGKWGSALMAALDERLPGHSISADAISPFLRDGFPWHRPDIPHPGLAAPEAWWANLYPVFVRAYVGAGLDEATARALAPVVRTHVIDPTTYLLYQDTLAALQELRSAGWEHVILSNHVPELADIVAGVGLGSLIAKVVTSAETGYEKPHTQAFRIALERAGNPACVWVVGDNPEADVRGGEAAGIRAILVRCEDASVSRQARDLREAARIIRNSEGTK